jgi:hypothetical protein
MMGNTTSQSVLVTVNKTNIICICSATHPVSIYRPRVEHTIHVYCECNFYNILCNIFFWFTKLIYTINSIITGEIRRENSWSIYPWYIIPDTSYESQTKDNIGTYLKLSSAVCKSFNTYVYACITSFPITSEYNIFATVVC